MLTGCFENQFRDHFAWFLQDHASKKALSKWVGRDSDVNDRRLFPGRKKGDIVLYREKKPVAIIELKAAYDFNVPTGHLDNLLMHRKKNLKKASLARDISRWKKLGVKLYGILLITYIPSDEKLPIICSKYGKTKARSLKSEAELKKLVEGRVKHYGWKTLGHFDVDLSRQIKKIVPGYTFPCSISGYLLKHPRY